MKSGTSTGARALPAQSPHRSKEGALLGSSILFATPILL